MFYCAYLLLGFQCASTNPRDDNPWLSVDLGRPIRIVSLNLTLASDSDNMVSNLEIRVGNGSGARDNALCKWFGKTVLVRRKQRNFVFNDCNGVGRFVSLSSVGATTSGSASLTVCDVKVLTTPTDMMNKNMCMTKGKSDDDRYLSTFQGHCVYSDLKVINQSW